MCLFSRIDSSRKVAECDIPCVKVLRRRLFWWRTPYIWAFVGRRVVKGRKDMKACGFEEVASLLVHGCRTGYRTVDGGFIHTYRTVMEVMEPRGRFEVYECVIPAGVEYYEGENGYASKSIRFVRRIG